MVMAGVGVMVMAGVGVMVMAGVGVVVMAGVGVVVVAGVGVMVMLGVSVMVVIGVGVMVVTRVSVMVVTGMVIVVVIRMARLSAFALRHVHVSLVENYSTTKAIGHKARANSRRDNIMAIHFRCEPPSRPDLNLPWSLRLSPGSQASLERIYRSRGPEHHGRHQGHSGTGGQVCIE